MPFYLITFFLYYELTEILLNNARSSRILPIALLAESYSKKWELLVFGKNKFGPIRFFRSSFLVSAHARDILRWTGSGQGKGAPFNPFSLGRWEILRARKMPFTMAREWGRAVLIWSGWAGGDPPNSHPSSWSGAERRFASSSFLRRAPRCRRARRHLLRCAFGPSSITSARP